jgi:paraquat-inducible protein B
MKRSHAFLLSAFLTVLVTGAFLTLAGQARARSAVPDTAPAPEAVAAPEDPYIAHEQALQSSIADLQNTLATVDGDYAAQVTAGEANVGIAQHALEARSESIAALEAEIQALQAAINQDAQGFANELATLQAGETQLRQQLEETLAALQSAYNDLAAQQAAQAASSGGGSNGNYDDHDDDDHGDDDHDDDDHDDDHEDHDEHDEHDEHDDD